MYMDTLLLLVSILSGISLSNVIGQTATSICDLDATLLCGTEAVDLALSTGCQSFVVIPILEECIYNNTNGCDDVEQNYWRDFVYSFREDLNQNCYSECGTTEQETITACLALYGGIGNLATDIIAQELGPNDAACKTALSAIKACVDEVTAICSSLLDSTRITLRQYETAFVLCNIPLESLTTEVTTVGFTEIPDTENYAARTTLVAAVSCSAVIVVVAGSIIICFWMKNQRSLNFLKRKSHTNSKLDRFREREMDSESYFTRDSLRHSRRHENNDTRSEFSMGPDRASGRWWTRPDFGTYGFQARPPRPF